MLQHVGMEKEQEVRIVMMAQMMDLDVVSDAQDGKTLSLVQEEIQQQKILVSLVEHLAQLLLGFLLVEQQQHQVAKHLLRKKQQNASLHVETEKLNVRKIVKMEIQLNTMDALTSVSSHGDMQADRQELHLLISIWHFKP